MDTTTALNIMWEAACRAELNMADSQKVIQAHKVLESLFTQQIGENDDHEAENH